MKMRIPIIRHPIKDKGWAKHIHLYNWGPISEGQLQNLSVLTIWIALFPETVCRFHQRLFVTTIPHGNRKGW